MKSWKKWVSPQEFVAGKPPDMCQEQFRGGVEEAAEPEGGHMPDRPGKADDQA